MTRTSASTDDPSADRGESVRGTGDTTAGRSSGQARVYPMRLQKFLARAGVASRRGSEDLMTAGRVTVNGVVTAELGAKVDPSVDEVAVDGVVVRLADGPTYLVLNKPAGYVTTMRDPQGRPTVAELMPKEPAGLFPVGRLDQATEGLLLLTTDGDLAQRLMHPRYHVPKTYLATVVGTPDAGSLKRLREGVELDDGVTAPAEADLERVTPDGGVVRLTIREGRKRQVRRMLGALGHTVTHLTRISFGPVSVGRLARGGIRELSAEEIAALKATAGLQG